MSETTLNICLQAFLWINVFIFLGKYLGVELLGHRMCMFIFIRHGQTIFQSGLIISVKNSVNFSVKF